jgi:uncharacterized membrane protein YebE (DUF533 family)
MERAHLDELGRKLNLPDDLKLAAGNRGKAALAAA